MLYTLPIKQKQKQNKIKSYECKVFEHTFQQQAEVKLEPEEEKWAINLKCIL
jgi:hypothetical protein